MKLQFATLTLSSLYAPHRAIAQSCTGGAAGSFKLKAITGACDYATLLEEYTRQVFDMTGSTCGGGGSTLTAKEDLDAKLLGAYPAASSGEEAGVMVCHEMYDSQNITPFVNAAGKSVDPTNLHFEQEFYNGGTDWQEEVETNYETEDGSAATSVLREDAARVREFFVGQASYSRVEYPESLTNFDRGACTTNAAMCCWPKDRQANDNNGNCAEPYDVNCVDKDPADNTNLCFADYAKGDASTNLSSSDGFAVFPGDNDAGEGSIHCHGYAWADDEYDSISRYTGNNLFFVSMYDHMHQRGYVKNVPGMPMCACMDQMPVTTRSDCTQVDLTEDWEMAYVDPGDNGGAGYFEGRMTKVEVEFNACQGRNGRNNDLWAYAARLYDEGRMTGAQFGKVGRVLTDDNDCRHNTEYEKQKKGLVTGHVHDPLVYTKVAGRDNLKDGEPHGREAFNKAFFEQTLTEKPIMLRICPDCIRTHRKVYYRRLTPAPADGLDILHNILFYRSNNPKTGNAWNVDFTLHSTYQDAETGANPWQCPGNNFNDRAPFDGECSPSGDKVQNQWSAFNHFPGPQPNVAYYVNKPELTGVQDYLDNESINHAEGLTDVDIGDVRLEGNTWEDDGVYHMTGAGNDIFGHADQFHYKSQPWSGDIDVRVHVSSLANNGGNGWAKAGIMLRSDNSDDATTAFALLSGTEGIATHRRPSKGNNMKMSQYKPATRLTSAWLRLLKKGDVIEYYRSEDGGDSWILMLSEDLFFPDDTYRVGLAITSHRADHLAEATFEDYTIEQYMFPTSAPSLSTAPTSWQPLVDIGEPQRPGTYSSIDYTVGDYWTACGATTGSCKGQETPEPVTSTHHVRCCADTNPGGEWVSCSINGGTVFGESEVDADGTCLEDATWQQATDACAALNARLCTKEEMLGDCTRGSGCGHDNEMVWTSTEVTGDDSKENIKGSGTGIWGTSDSFAFHNHQVANGPITMEMYVKKFDNNSPHSRAGLMVRDSGDADAANAFVGAAGQDQGAVLQSRPTAGAATRHHKMIYANSDNHMWVKMTVDAGGVVTGYYKINEADGYIQLGQTQITLTGDTILVGRAVTAGEDFSSAEVTVTAQRYSYAAL